MQPKFLEVQIARIAAVFQRRKLEMDAVCELGMNVAKIWEPLVELNQDRFLLQQIPEEFYQIIQHKS